MALDPNFITVNYLGAGGGRIPSAYHSGSGRVTLKTAVLGREESAGREDGIWQSEVGPGGLRAPRTARASVSLRSSFGDCVSSTALEETLSPESDKALSGAAVYV